MPDFVMPSLGADMAAATLVKWHVAPGQAVRRGDIIAEVDTEKGLIDIECFQEGVVGSLDVEPGTKVPVGAKMATIVAPPTPGSKPEPDLRAAPGPAATPSAELDRVPVPASTTGSKSEPDLRTRQRVSPLARARAATLGVDLTGLRGTGPGGAVEVEDVERAAAASSPAAASKAVITSADVSEPVALQPAAPMRRAIAAAMAKSKREIPHYYLQTRIDMSAAVAWLQAENQQRPISERMLPAVVLLKATAHALHDVPQLNGYWADDRHQVIDRINIGFAIALKGGGLVAPAIPDVGGRSCAELMAALRELIPRARTGRLRSSEMSDATITITNLGDLGVESVLGVIYPPQVALVGFGRIIEQPWVVDGTVAVRPVLAASLAADHRATDGHIGAQFLDALTRHLQSPETL